MAGHGEKFSRSQEKAIAALLVQPTIKAAAKAAGVGERTLQLWLKDAAFLDAYRAARRGVLEVALTGLQGATGQAVKTLRKNLRHGTGSIAVKAAAVVLSHAVKAAELLDLAERVEALERQAAARARR